MLWGHVKLCSRSSAGDGHAPKHRQILPVTHQPPPEPGGRAAPESVDEACDISNVSGNEVFAWLFMNIPPTAAEA